MTLFRSLVPGFVAVAVVASTFGATPDQVTILVAPSRLDGFYAPVGNVRVTYSDGRTELLTTGGDCRDVHMSAKHDIGWIKMENVHVEPNGAHLSGNDILKIRLADGAMKEFWPHPGTRFIEKWLFTDKDAAVVIRSMGFHGPSSFVKYQISDGRMLGDVPGYTPYDKLPDWAKQLADPNE